MVLSLSAGGTYISSFPGTTEIPIKDYYSTIDYTWHYVGNEVYQFHLPNSPFNAYTNFVPGSSYFIHTLSETDIIIP